MIEVVEQIFGVYTPADGGGINYAYFVGVAIFLVVLYSALRILGSVICGGKR